MPNVKPLLVALGCATLVGCASTASSGSRPTRFVTIQPIQVCNDFGLDCADLATFADATFKIWAQADIQVTFLPPNRLLGTRFLTIDSRDEFSELSFSGGTGDYGRHPFSTRTSGPINMWFVDEIVQGLFDVFGLAWIDQNGVLISDNILTFNNGRGRIDTVAHELGHNLGLSHSDFGAGNSNNLLSSGSDRAVPSSILDINPDGARLSRLTNDQVDRARTSSLVTGSANPAPSNSPPNPFSGILPFLDDGDYDAVPFPGLVAAGTGEDEVTAAANPVVGAADLAVAVSPTAESASPKKIALPQVQDRSSLKAGVRASSPQAVPEPGTVSWLSGGLLALLFWRGRRG